MQVKHASETEMMKMKNVFENFSRHEARGTLKFYFENRHGVIGGSLFFGTPCLS